MKQIFYLPIITVLTIMASCNPGQDVVAPACDNTTNSMNVELFWDKASYDCPDIINNDPNVTPPLATAFNYLLHRARLEA
jgi:hypothetical protein